MQNEILPNFLKNRAFLTPERNAVYFNDVTLTFGELYDLSYKKAGQLSGLGLKKGDYVGVLLKNHLDTVVIYFALQLLGARTVILNNRLTPAELSWQLLDSKAQFFIYESAFAEVNSYMDGKLDILRISKEELQDLAMAEVDLQEELSLKETCTIMYTSGTTGNPKGVIQSYGNHWWSAVGSALNLGLNEKDCWLCTVPLFHISGFSILMKSVIYGMPIVLHENFDVEQTVKDIEEKNVTIMSVVGAMLMRLVEVYEERKLPNQFRCMLLGGGPAPLSLLQDCVERGVPVFQTYGMTESSSQVVTLSPEYSIEKLGSAGKPLFPAQIQILSSNGQRQPHGEAGEIFIKGPNVTPGYLNNPNATKDKLCDGWFATGDIGYLDQEGFLYVLDRRSDLIISGGENIYPAEIEAVLLSHSSVEDAGVTGIEDEKWGQVPVAFLVTRHGRAVEEKELMDFCLQRLAKYKVPKRFYFVKELPRNAAKKLLRRKLREWLQVEGRGR